MIKKEKRKNKKINKKLNKKNKQATQDNNLNIRYLDLAYLKNPQLKEDTIKTQNIIGLDKEDINFYKIRIFEQTRNLLKGEGEVTPIIQHSFNEYINQSIRQFKFIDKQDIIQKNIGHQCNIKTNKKDLSFNDVDFFKKKKVPKNIQIDQYLDIRKKKKQQRQMILPQEVNYNLKDPSLKHKGVNQIIKKSN